MRFKRKHWRGLSIRAARRRICFWIGFPLLFCGFLVSYWKMAVNYKDQYSLLEQQVLGKSRTAYLPINNIPAGQMILEEDLGKALVISDIGQEWYLTSKDFGRQALIDLPANQPILSYMTGEEKVTDDLREEEFQLIDLMSNQWENDYVDVRIMFESGENYLVLSKKKIRNLNLEENRCFFWMSAEEILRMSSAIVDVYLQEGAKLYTVKYIEHYLQEESIPNYPVNSVVLSLLASDPNILNIAKKELNNRGGE